MDEFQKLKDLILAAEEDADKFYEKGNASAGTRLRKSLLEAKNLCHELRKKVQEAKNTK